MSPKEGKGFTKVEVERNRSFGIRPGPDLWERALQEEVTTTDTAEIWDLERELGSRSRGSVKVWVTNQIQESQDLHSST